MYTLACWQPKRYGNGAHHVLWCSAVDIPRVASECQQLGGNIWGHVCWSLSTVTDECGPAKKERYHTCSLTCLRTNMVLSEEMGINEVS